MAAFREAQSNRLRRRTQCRDRLPLRRGSIRPVATIGRRYRPARCKVIAALGGSPAALAAKSATTSIPSFSRSALYRCNWRSASLGQAGRKRYRNYEPCCRGRAKAAGGPSQSGARRVCHGCSGQPQQSGRRGTTERPLCGGANAGTGSSSRESEHRTRDRNRHRIARLARAGGLATTAIHSSMHAVRTRDTGPAPCCAGDLPVPRVHRRGGRI